MTGAIDEALTAIDKVFRRHGPRCTARWQVSVKGRFVWDYKALPQRQHGNVQPSLCALTRVGRALPIKFRWHRVRWGVGGFLKFR
jgi:hypothetical protein